MQQTLALFLPQVVEPRRQETKLDGIEEIALSSTISTDERVVATCEGLYRVLLAEASEAADLDRLYGERRHASLFEFARLWAGRLLVLALAFCLLCLMFRASEFPRVSSARDVSITRRRLLSELGESLPLFWCVGIVSVSGCQDDECRV